MSASKVIAKAIKFTAQAQEHDTSVKVKNVLKWLKMGHEVRVSIVGSADRQKAMETIYKQLEKDIKSGANFSQKNVKPRSISVVLKPTEDAVNFEISDVTKTKSTDVDAELNKITAEGEDVFSSEFEKKLLNSIREDKSKNKKHQS